MNYAVRTFYVWTWNHLWIDFVHKFQVAAIFFQGLILLWKPQPTGIAAMHIQKTWLSCYAPHSCYDSLFFVHKSKLQRRANSVLEFGQVHEQLAFKQMNKCFLLHCLCIGCHFTTFRPGAVKMNFAHTNRYIRGSYIHYSLIYHVVSQPFSLQIM